MGNDVLLYVPNVIGYIRLILLFVAFCKIDHPNWCLLFYIISISLDALDGIAARHLNQTSAFGAWFDIWIDLIGRGMLWSYVYNWGYFMIAIEWTVFVCTHSQAGGKWKSEAQQAPLIVQKIMEKNFKTIYGVIAMGSLNILPILLYGHYYHFFRDHFYIPSLIVYLGIGLLWAGRAVCLLAECWFIWIHIEFLLNEDGNTISKSSSNTSINDTKS